MKIEDILNEVKKGTGFNDVAGHDAIIELVENSGGLVEVGMMGSYRISTQEKDRDMFIIFDLETPVGFFDVTSSSKKYGYPILAHAFIEPGYRNRGIVPSFIKFYLSQYNVSSLVLDKSLSEPMRMSINKLKGVSLWWYNTMTKEKHEYSDMDPEYHDDPTMSDTMGFGRKQNKYYPIEYSKADEWLIMVE